MWIVVVHQGGEVTDYSELVQRLHDMHHRWTRYGVDGLHSGDRDDTSLAAAALEAQAAEIGRLRLAMTEAYWIINYPTDSKEHHDRRKNWIHEHADDYLEVTQRDGLNSRSWLKEEK